jgi:site-specific DNA-cytosine methylase
MRIIDLFCGIGGVAEAIGMRSLAPCTGGASESRPHVVAAIDIDRIAIAVYAANHGLTARCAALESIRQLPTADLWWLSPPCQPYTARGRGRGELDARSAALAHLIELIDRDRPERLAVENVPAFAGSVHQQRLVAVLEAAGYTVRCELLCPTRWGVPMRRRRFYLLARRGAAPIPELSAAAPRRPLAEFLDEPAWDDPQLRVAAELRQRYRGALHVVEAVDQGSTPGAGDTTACFTAAYGKSPVQAGSYLRCRHRGITRRFSPIEIARLMGFSDSFHWPSEVTLRNRYRLLGNSLSVTVARELLGALTTP